MGSDHMVIDPFKTHCMLGQMAHACNPSYLGGRDQEDQGQIVHETLSQKKTHHKKGLVEWLKV
jgi:hypothetical protein